MSLFDDVACFVGVVCVRVVSLMWLLFFVVGCLSCAVVCCMFSVTLGVVL